MPTTSSAGSEPARSQDMAAVKSADRVLDILELLARQESALTHHEIGTTLGIPKSSLTHLLRNLVAREFLVHDPGRAVFSLGPAVFRLVAGKHDRDGLLHRARPVVDWMAEVTGEACAFSVLRNDEVERVCVAESRSPLSYRMAVGDRFPLHSTSAGKVMLAAMEPGQLAACLQRMRLERYTGTTVRSVAQLKRELKQIQATGIAYSQGEHTPGVVGIAIAVRAGADAAPAALNIVVPSVRFSPEVDAACLQVLRQARERFEAEGA